ncbi:MAG: helix-turn-helix domain-containing protein [Candidatus Helarchaeales archaeon]
MSPEDAAYAELEIKIPDDVWLNVLSIKYPETIFEIQTILPTENFIGNALIRIINPNAEQIIKDIKKHPSLVKLDVYSKGPDSYLINVKTKDPYLLVSLIKSEVLLEYPIRVQNGWTTWKVISDRSRISILLDKLKERSVEFRLKQISQYKDKVSLTRRQMEVLDLALKLGYYDIPRKITLTELAKKLKMSKSSLSELLRRITRKRIAEVN